MNSRAKSYLMVLCGSLLPLVAVATLPQTRPTASASVQAPAGAPGGKWSICFDTLFYGPMPGLTNYCLGMRDWKNGRYASGLEMLKLAAGWGNKSAQYTLGLIYYNGHHVAMNRALGLAWLELADQRHNDPQITRVLQAATKWATGDERAEAHQLFTQMLGRYDDNVAAARAWHHLRHWQRHRGTNAGVVCVYGRQAWALTHAGLRGIAPRMIVQAMRTVSARSKTPMANNGVCGGVGFAVQQAVVQQSAGNYFRGWIGNVTVGPLQQVPAAASSAAH